MRIRQAAAAYAEAISEVLRASIRQLCAADHKSDPEAIARWCANKTPQTVGAWIEDPQQRLFVAEDGGAILAVGATTTSGEILLNYVSPKARLRGVSKAMLGRLEAEIAALGIAEARLASTVTAHRFYLAAGWRDDGLPQCQFGLPCLPMVKSLAGVRAD